jgi:hypothetical protein
LSFWGKVSCEHDEDNAFSWDRLMVYTNNVEVVDWRMDGETEWTVREVSFEGGENTVKWVYYKDKSGVDGEDCAWVDGVTWTPIGTAVAVQVNGANIGIVADFDIAHLAEFFDKVISQYFRVVSVFPSQKGTVAHVRPKELSRVEFATRNVRRLAERNKLFTVRPRILRGRRIDLLEFTMDAEIEIPVETLKVIGGLHRRRKAARIMVPLMDARLVNVCRAHKGSAIPFQHKNTASEPCTEKGRI